MKKTIQILILALFTLIGTELTAQMSFGFNFHHTEALDTYKENLHRNPNGILFSALFKPQKSKNFRYGIEFGISMYADENYFYELPTGEYAGETIEMYEEDCFFTYNAVARYSLNESATVTPYVEARLGGLSFFSTRMAADEAQEDYYNSITKFHGTALQGGLGGGLVWRVAPCVAIDLGASYNLGTRADYRSIEEGSIALRRSLDYGKYNSAIKSVGMRIGVLCGF